MLFECIAHKTIATTLKLRMTASKKHPPPIAIWCFRSSKTLPLHARLKVTYTNLSSRLSRAFSRISRIALADTLIPILKNYVTISQPTLKILILPLQQEP